MDRIDNIIRENEKTFNSRPLQWDLDSIKRKLCLEKEEETAGSLLVPAYQRNYVWTEEAQSLFIESLLLNIPIPYIFLNQDEKNWEIEIVDWYQRIRTIYEFMNGNFILIGLEKLKELNGKWYNDFSTVRKSLFDTKTLNIVLFSNLDEDQKKEMFSRINTTWEELNKWEQRKWWIGWEFYELMNNLYKENDIVKEMIKVSPKKKDREEVIELILRYFAYTSCYNDYHGKIKVYKFLDEYMKEKNRELVGSESLKIKKKMEDNFLNMLMFVKKYFPSWFKKKKTNKVISSRTYYEAISVWVWLALEESKEELLHVDMIPNLLKNKKFKEIVSSGWANAPSKFRWRVSAVRNLLVEWKLPE